jgi:hypothetical protein
VRLNGRIRYPLSVDLGQRLSSPGAVALMMWGTALMLGWGLLAVKKHTAGNAVQECDTEFFEKPDHQVRSV